MASAPNSAPARLTPRRLRMGGPTGAAGISSAGSAAQPPVAATARARSARQADRQVSELPRQCAREFIEGRAILVGVRRAPHGRYVGTGAAAPSAEAAFEARFDTL